MKKLMIAAAIVCAAVASQAATANWKAAATGVMNGTGVVGGTGLYSGTAYFFDASKISQSALFEAFAANTATFDATKQAGYVASGSVANGTMAATSNTFAYGDRSGDDKVYQDFFFALVDGDKMYLSITKADVQASGTDAANQIAFGAQKTTSLPDSSLLPTEGFKNAGQWAQAVPEPTSGLLLLLGVAGLALRRRRA